MRLKVYRIPLNEFTSLLRDGNAIKIEGGPPSTSRFIRVSLLPGTICLTFEDASFSESGEDSPYPPAVPIEATTDNEGFMRFILESRVLFEEEEYKRALEV